ncbi:hypothetical protein KIN20_006561, partial [Parelaphostrongylus tenuis]
SMITWRFDVTGFSLPVAMTFYSRSDAGTSSRYFTEFRSAESTRKALVMHKGLNLHKQITQKKPGVKPWEKINSETSSQWPHH